MLMIIGNGLWNGVNFLIKIMPSKLWKIFFFRCKNPGTVPVRS